MPKKVYIHAFTCWEQINTQQICILYSMTLLDSYSKSYFFLKGYYTPKTKKLLKHLLQYGKSFPKTEFSKIA